MRLSAVAACLACLTIAACAPADSRAQPPSDEELRLVAFLARDPFVIVERTERDGDGRLLVVTRQGRTRQRYLIAPDDPAKPALRLRRLEDACTLVTVPNERLGGGPVTR